MTKVHGFTRSVWDHLLSRNDHLFFLLVIGSTLLRLPTFFPVVIDHDESTYLVIAQEMLKGRWPYVDVIDIKPPGIYLIFASIQLIVGKSIFAIRLFTSVCIGITAFFISKVHTNLFGRSRYSIYCGISYVLFVSLHKWGWTPNTEIFAALFVIIALWILSISDRKTHFILAGLLLGFGTIFRYHVLFDALAFGIFVISRFKLSMMRTMMAAVLGLFGFFFPILILVATYWHGGYLDELRIVLFELPGKYVSKISAIDRLLFLLEFLLIFGPVSLLFLAEQGHRFKHKNFLNTTILSISWILLVWLGIYITGKKHFHYYVSALLPFTLFLFPLTNRLWILTRSKMSLKPVVVISIVMLACWINQIHQLYPSNNQDIIRLKTYVEQQVESNEMYYTENLQILYYLTGHSPPTPYVHSTILTNDELAISYGIDRREELTAIIDKEPELLLLQGENLMSENASYAEQESIGSVRIYHRQ